MRRSEWGGGGGVDSTATKRGLEPYLVEDRGEEAYSFTPVSRFVCFFFRSGSSSGRPARKCAVKGSTS